MKKYLKVTTFIIIAIPVYVSSVFSLLVYLQSNPNNREQQVVYVSEGSEDELVAELGGYIDELPQTGDSDNTEDIVEGYEINRYCAVKTIKNEEPVELNPDKVFNCSAFLDDGVYKYSADVLDMAAEIDENTIMIGQCVNASKETTQNEDGSYDVIYTDCLMY